MKRREDLPDIRAYIAVLVRRRKLIVFGIIVCLLAAGVVTYYTSPVYESSTTLLVSEGHVVMENYPTAADSYQSLLLTERLAKSYSQMMTGRAIAKKVVTGLRLDVSPAELTSRITAEPLRDTNFIKVTVVDRSPRRSQQIAEATVSAFSKEIESLTSFGSKTNLEPLVRVNVVEPPDLPSTPIRPKPLLNIVLGLILGIVGSTGFAYVVEYLDVSIRNGEDLERSADLPLLGLIPVGESAGGPEVLSKPASLTTEAYRTIRTNLQYLNYDKSLRTIAVTSPQIGEGKTTVASNLAAAISKSGARVILISCDLRRPSLHRVFNVDNIQGTSSVLAGEADFEDVLITVDEGLKIVTSGPLPPNPAELLGSDRMKQMVERAEQLADTVVLDCPPLLAVTDAAVLAPLVRGFLLVARAGQTNRHAVAQGKTTLDKVSARVLGTVLNCFNPSLGYSYSSGYQYYYRDAYAEQKS